MLQALPQTQAFHSLPSYSVRVFNLDLFLFSVLHTFTFSDFSRTGEDALVLQLLVIKVFLTSPLI